MCLWPIIHVPDLPYGETISSGAFAILSSVYTGIIVTRLSRFEDLRSQARRIVRDLDYVVDSKGQPEVFKFPEVNALLHVSSDLISMGHKVAAHSVNLIISDIISTQENVPHYNIFQTKEDYWQKETRLLKINWLKILNFNIFKI